MFSNWKNNSMSAMMVEIVQWRAKIEDAEEGGIELQEQCL